MQITKNFSLFQHTAARRRLAYNINRLLMTMFEFQHTAARRRLVTICFLSRCLIVSTHSRPKAAVLLLGNQAGKARFQHTAARRRLQVLKGEARGRITVSTHSRPKAAGP